MKILVLGAGLVGGPMALDLAKDPHFDVTVADLSKANLQAIEQRWKSLSIKGFLTGKPLQTIRQDLSDPAQVTELVSDFDMAINAVPGFMGYQTLKAIIEAGKNVVDIAFFIEDPFDLNDLAEQKGVTALMDMGVAPGMCNVLIGYADSQLDETDDVIYLVGGLPVVREWPYEYKAVFSPVDVIEEYIRPARFIENGIMIVKPALSDPELIDFPGVGTLEAFNTDGLRSLVRTIKCRNMKEKTLRYPGHIEKMRMLRETGFFSRNEVEVNGSLIRPIDLTARLLFPKWKLREGEADITVMKVVVEGKKDGKRIRFTWDLIDRYDETTGIHSMARATGYTATVALRMIADGVFTRKGISVPEFVGQQPGCVDYLLKGLGEKNVRYHQKTEYF